MNNEQYSVTFSLKELVDFSLDLMLVYPVLTIIAAATGVLLAGIFFAHYQAARREAWRAQVDHFTTSLSMQRALRESAAQVEKVGRAKPAVARRKPVAARKPVARRKAVTR